MYRCTARCGLYTLWCEAAAENLMLNVLTNTTVWRTSNLQKRLGTVKRGYHPRWVCPCSLDQFINPNIPENISIFGYHQPTTSVLSLLSRIYFHFSWWGQKSPSKWRCPCVAVLCVGCSEIRTCLMCLCTPVCARKGRPEGLSSISKGNWNEPGLIKCFWQLLKVICVSLEP